MITKILDIIIWCIGWVWLLSKLPRILEFLYLLAFVPGRIDRLKALYRVIRGMKHEGSGPRIEE